MTMVNKSNVISSNVAELICHIIITNCNNNNFNGDDFDRETFYKHSFSFLLEKHYYITVSGIKLE